MVMQTDLDLNGSRVVNSVHYLHGYLHTQNGNNNGFVLNGSHKTALPQRSIIKGRDPFHCIPTRIPAA